MKGIPLQSSTRTSCIKGNEITATTHWPHGATTVRSSESYIILLGAPLARNQSRAEYKPPYLDDGVLSSSCRRPQKTRSRPDMPVTVDLSPDKGRNYIIDDGNETAAGEAGTARVEVHETMPRRAPLPLVGNPMPMVFLPPSHFEDIKTRATM